MKQSRLLILFATTLSVACLSHAATPDPHSRLVVVARDTTPSYCCLDEAEQRIKEVVRCLGPGDSFFLIDIASSFQPKNHLKVILTLPPIPQELLDQQTLTGLRDRGRRLNGLLAGAEMRKAKILSYLDRSVSRDSVGTDIHGVLAYVAQLMADVPAEEKYLFLFTDLLHELRDVRTDRPPSKQLSMSGVRATVLFMPYDANWGARKLEWRHYFEQAGAMSVLFLDAAMSRTAPLLPRKPLPRTGGPGLMQ